MMSSQKSLAETSPSTEGLKTVQKTEKKGIFSHMNNVVVSCMVGNALEWYDFAIYGFFAEIIGRQFFPSSSPVAQLLMSLGIFAIGFLARPAGAIIFGQMGDKVGRKDALMYSIYLMAIPTALIGMLPGYNTLGMLAPVTLIFLRILQGIAIGGEFTGSIVFLVEHAQKNERGLAGSWASFSLLAGVLIGSGVAALFASILTAEQLETFGWRIPFIISVFGSLVGTYMRRNLVDPEVFRQAKAKQKESKMDLKVLFSTEYKRISVVMLLDFMNAVGFFLVIIFMPVFFKTFLDFPAHVAQTIHTFNMIVFAVMTVVGGQLSDRFGRKVFVKYPALFLIFASYPLFALFQPEQYVTAFAIELIFSVVLGAFFGALPALLCEIFSTRTRFSGVSIGHNLSMALFGGTTPMIATHVINVWDNLAAPAVILIVASILTLLSLHYIEEMSGKPLAD
jgi:MHS family proline/betaine transporter-like MFS transporter